MKRTTFMLTLLFVSLINLSTYAQHYAGKFNSKPALTEFEQFIVMQNPENEEKDLSVKAFSVTGELWHSVASSADAEIVREVTKNFKGELDISSVYRLDLNLNGESLYYYLLGYKNRTQDENFIIVAEWYHEPGDIVPVEVNTFEWSYTTAQN